MARTLLVVSLFAGSASLLVGCTQDFNVFKPGQGGASATSTTSPSVTASVTVSTTTGAGGAPQCTDTDLSKCDATNICAPPSCVGGQCKNTAVADGLAPGYTDTPTDCVDDICTAGVLMKAAPDNTEIPDDMNVCTIDTCAAGAPVHTPDATMDGMSCGAAPQVCDNGQCVGCITAAMCMGSDTECKIRTCSAAHVCGTMDLLEGMPTTMGQTADDCHTVRCVAGTATNQIDDTDKPVDGIVCTQDVCTNGVATNPPQGVAFPCGAGAACTDMTHQKLADHCNGAGACSAQSPTLCTPNFNCTGNLCNTACTDNTHCQTGFVCDVNAGSANLDTCVLCDKNADCLLATAPVCDLTAASSNFDTCQECSTTGTNVCAGKKAPKGITCQPSGGNHDKCACAVDADCINPFAGACNAGTGACGCTADVDCASGMCNTGLKVCM